MNHTFNPDRHHRRSIRLINHDYSGAGTYFVTICAWNRECLFGEVENGQMRLNEYGKIARDEWEKSADIRKEIELHEFIVMPNHFHGIVTITNSTNHAGTNEEGEQPKRANGRSPLRVNNAVLGECHSPPRMKPKSISSLISGFKSAVSKRINVIRNAPSSPIWQRNYYEHVIRNESEGHRICEYIVNNPMRWAEDENNPSNMQAG